MSERSPTPPETIPFVTEREAMPFSEKGLFWLEPQALDDTVARISSSSFGTMHIGAANRRGEIDATLGDIAQKLVPDTHENIHVLRSALDFGYLYGSLAAGATERLVSGDDAWLKPDIETDTRLSSLLQNLYALAEKIEVSRDSDVNTLFLWLRDAEILLAGSDIMAYSLARAQSHLADEFQRFHDGEREHPAETDVAEGGVGSKNNDSAERLRLQTLFYAGALVGAAYNTPELQRTKTDMVILRSMVDDEGLLRSQPMESGGALANDIERAFSEKLRFGTEHAGWSNMQPYAIYATRGAYQSGPQTSSQPDTLFDEESPGLQRWLFEDLEGVVVRCVCEMTGTDVIRVYRPDVYRDNFAGLPAHTIAGIINRQGIWSGYDYYHPTSEAIRAAAIDVLGRDTTTIGYTNRILKPTAELQLGLGQYRRGRLAALLGGCIAVTGVFSVVLHEILGARSMIIPVTALAIEEIVLAGLTLPFMRAKHRIREDEIRIAETGRQIDHTIDSRESTQ